MAYVKASDHGKKTKQPQIMNLSNRDTITWVQTVFKDKKQMELTVNL